MIGAQLGAQRPHQPHRLRLLRIGIPTRRRPTCSSFCNHDSILASKLRSLQQTQCDSTEPETSRDDPGLSFNTTNLAINPDLHREARLDEIQRRLQESYLRVVPDPPDDTGGAAEEGDGPLVPDVLGAERQRDAYRAAMPNLTDAELDEYLNVYTNSLSPKTVRSYESALAPY